MLGETSVEERSHSGQQFTYQDYLGWSEDERWEIVNGKALNMTPAPSVSHQRIVRKINGHFWDNRDKLKNCEFFSAPIDVVFDEYNVVQPDFLVVCSKKQILEKNIQGAPELVIEVISPSSSSYDRREKKALYESFGVNEYIIIYPDLCNIERYVLEKNSYGKPEILNHDDTLSLKTFSLEIKLNEIFDTPVSFKTTKKTPQTK